MYKHLTISQLEISSFAWPKYAFKARLLPESTLFQFLLKKEQLNYKMEIFRIAETEKAERLRSDQHISSLSESIKTITKEMNEQNKALKQNAESDKVLKYQLEDLKQKLQNQENNNKELQEKHSAVMSNLYEEGKKRNEELQRENDRGIERELELKRELKKKNEKLL